MNYLNFIGFFYIFIIKLSNNIHNALLYMVINRNIFILFFFFISFLNVFSQNKLKSIENRLRPILANEGIRFAESKDMKWTNDRGAINKYNFIFKDLFITDAKEEGDYIYIIGYYTVETTDVYGKFKGNLSYGYFAEFKYLLDEPSLQRVFYNPKGKEAFEEKVYLCKLV